MRILPAGILVLFLSAPSHAIAECDTDIPTDASMPGYTIGEVHVDARWGKRIASERLRLRPGDPYSRTAIFDAMEATAAALNEGSVHQPFDLQTQRTFVRLVRPCVVVHESAKTTD